MKIKSEELGEKPKENLAEEEKKKKKEKKSTSPKNRSGEEKKTEKQKRLERFGWFFLAMSALALFLFFIGSFVGKFWFKVCLSLVIGFIIGKKSTKWRWRILIFIFVSFISMIYAGETAELFRYAILATGGSASVLFGLEEWKKWNVYPRGMLPVFMVTVIICAGLLLGDLFSDHSEIVAEQKVSVSNLQEEAEIEKQLSEKFSFSNNREIEIPEFLLPVKILEEKEAPNHELLQDWLSVKIKNYLPAEYGRVNSVIRRALFIIFLFAVHVVFVPVGSLEAAKDYLKRREEKDKKGKKEKEPVHQDIFSFYGMVQMVQDTLNLFKKQKR